MRTLETRIEEIMFDTTGRKITEVVLEIAKQFGDEKVKSPIDLVDEIYKIVERDYPCIEYTIPNNSYIKTFVLPKGSSFGMIRNDS